MYDAERRVGTVAPLRELMSRPQRTFERPTIDTETTTDPWSGSDTGRQALEPAVGGTMPSQEGTMRTATTSVTGYCMKCTLQREIKDIKRITLKNGRPAAEGGCPVCGTKMFTIGASE